MKSLVYGSILNLLGLLTSPRVVRLIRELVVSFFDREISGKEKKKLLIDVLELGETAVQREAAKLAPDLLEFIIRASIAWGTHKFGVQAHNK